MKYYIIAGEASGDLHGSNLMRGIMQADPQAEFRFWGGDLMATVGGTQVKHYRDTAFMGVLEVVANLRTIFRNMKQCKNDLLEYRPDVLILIDYPGFNLRIAEFAHQQGIRTYYYISPKIWAWKQSRVHRIKRFVNRMYVIFPFEIDFYRQFDYTVYFAGNPLLDALPSGKPDMSFAEFCKSHQLNNLPIVTLMPGSREAEVRKILPDMIAATRQFNDVQFVIAGTSVLGHDFYTKLLPPESNIKVLIDQTYTLLQHSRAAVVKSGTSTLETALLNVPQVVVYKMLRISFEMAKMVVKIPFVSLVNIIMQRQVVVEILQNDLQQRIVEELKKLLYDNDYRNRMLSDYERLQQSMGSAGASQRIASLMVEHLKTDKT